MSPVKGNDFTSKSWKMSFFTTIKNSNVDDYFYNSQNEALLNIVKLNSAISYYYDHILFKWLGFIVDDNKLN